MSHPTDVCRECGAEIDGGTAACHELIADLTVRSPDPRRLVVRRMVVDAYALQHPDSRCHSTKDVAERLLRLCCALEYDNSLEIQSGMASWLRRARDLPVLTPPTFRGAITVVDADAAESIEEYIEKVRKWALSVWEAWHEHHDTVRRWIEEIRDR